MTDGLNMQLVGRTLRGHRRPHLRAVAYRMLGSLSEAEDAVQESWLRLSRSDTSGVENLGGWLTTVVARICLEPAATRATSRPRGVAGSVSCPSPSRAVRAESTPSKKRCLADSVGLALLVVLDTLTPAERLAFVLHDIFDVPFDEIATVVRALGGGDKAARQPRTPPGAGSGHGAGCLISPGNEKWLMPFSAASRAGDFDALLAVLDPDVGSASRPRRRVCRAPQCEVRGARGRGPAVLRACSGGRDRLW